MKLSAFIGCLLLTNVVSAWPGVRRRQAQPVSDGCTCPATGPTTTTVVQFTIVTSTVTSTIESGTTFITAPASTTTITTTSTASIATGTTTLVSTVTETNPATSTSVSIITTTTTTCSIIASRKVKRQNSNTQTASTVTTLDPRPTVTFASTISSRAVTCTCTPRPRVLTSSCSCPATTATTITLTSTSSGVAGVIYIFQTPATVTVTPTFALTETNSNTVTSSVLATAFSTQTSSTVTIQQTVTSLSTSIVTVNDCPATSTTTFSTNTFTGPVASATDSFGCNSTAYLVTTLNGQITLYNIDLNSGATIVFAAGVGAGTYTTMNALGFNARDNFLYAVGYLASSSTTFAVVRLTTTGSVQEVLRFTSNGLPSVGDFDLEGQFWISNGGTDWWHIDLLPGSPTYGTIINSGTSTLDGYNVRDWSYLGSRGNFMYSIGITTAATNPTYGLLRWSLTDHTWTVQQAYNVVASESNIATWGGNNGTIWGYSANTGRITRIILPDGTPTQLGTGPTGITGGDGARCALAS